MKCRTQENNTFVLKYEKFIAAFFRQYQFFNYDTKSLAHAIFQLHTNKHQLPAFKHHAVMSGKQYVWSKIEPMFLEAIQDLIASKQENYSFNNL